MNSLTSEQQAFFQQIADLAFVNPFSLEHNQTMRQLIGQGAAKLSVEECRKGLTEKLKQQFSALNPQQAFDIRQYSGDSQHILLLAWLQLKFYQYQNRFDAYIKAQRQAGDKTLELPFAKEIQAEFERAGFDAKQSSHYIALLFQLQRAFRFIDDAVSGNSAAMVELRKRLWNNIFTFNPAWYLDYLCRRMEDFSLLLLGETGTGKSWVAKAVGCSGYIPFDLSTRKFVESFTVSFNAINLSQYSTGVLESELFGHKKGAFTGAIDNNPGLLAKCSRHGSIFIDEIGEIDTTIQVKLLNVLQDRQFSPVGSRDLIRFEGRVISATNRPIKQLIESGKFRPDFYYRLCSDVITLPSLKERIEQNPDELQELVGSLLGRVIELPTEDLVERMTARVREAVPKAYHWPGNVRELEQCIRRICITGSYQAKTESASLLMDAGRSLMPKNGETPTAQQLLQSYCRQLYQRHRSYETVARIANLDRRTVKKYIDFDEAR